MLWLVVRHCIENISFYIELVNSIKGLNDPDDLLDMLNSFYSEMKKDYISFEAFLIVFQDKKALDLLISVIDDKEDLLYQ